MAKSNSPSNLLADVLGLPKNIVSMSIYCDWADGGQLFVTTETICKRLDSDTMGVLDREMKQYELKELSDGNRPSET